MPARRRVPIEGGRAAVRSWAAAPDGVPRATLATAVRYCLEELAARHPGHTLEVRVPPFGVTQCLEGPRHTRGTPPNVVETDAATWLALASGVLGWRAAVDGGLVRASGLRADLDGMVPLVDPAHATVGE